MPGRPDDRPLSARIVDELCFVLAIACLAGGILGVAYEAWLGLQALRGWCG